jgi:hypothetical protein
MTSRRAGTVPFKLSDKEAFSWRAERSPSAPDDCGASNSGALSPRPTRGSTTRRRRRSGCVVSRSRTAPPPRWSCCLRSRGRHQKCQARLSIRKQPGGGVPTRSGPPHLRAHRHSAKLLRLCSLRSYWSRASRHRQQRHFRRLLRHITRIGVRMGNWLLVDAIVAGIARRETVNRGAAIKRGPHVIPQTEYGQAGPGHSRTRGYVAIVGPITRYFPKDGRWMPHKRLGHITEADWRKCAPCGGGADRRRMHDGCLNGVLLDFGPAGGLTNDMVFLASARHNG